MHFNRVVGPMRTLAFRTWRALTVAVPGARIQAFGPGTDQIGAVLVVNLERQPRRWRRVTKELGRFRTSEGKPLTSITRRLAAVDARDGRAVAATADVDPTYRIGDQLYVQPDARLAECFAEDEPVRMTRQEVAVARSHVEAWKVVANGTGEYVLVLEDDVWFSRGAPAAIDSGWRTALGGWCQMGVWCAGVGGGGTGAVSGRVLWCGGVCWGLSGRCWAGVGRSGAQPRAHRCGVERSPSTPRRAMLAAAASRLKSASTLARPRTRAWRPPCFRRTRCASLRSTLGRTAR